MSLIFGTNSSNRLTDATCDQLQRCNLLGKARAGNENRKTRRKEEAHSSIWLKYLNSFSASVSLAERVGD
eukprot:2526965-Karenia_brevis.AAC.1